MFIKDIKLWDLTYVGPYTLFDFDKFSYITPKGLIHWYNLDITNLNNNNKIIIMVLILIGMI